MIGITGNNTTNQHQWEEFQEDYTPSGFPQGVVKAGHLPVIIPIQSDLLMADQYVSQLDGLIFTGGQDVSPLLFGQDPLPELQDLFLKRDQWEMALFQAAQKRQLPILAVCRGLQLINWILGGTVYQDYKYYPIPNGKKAVQHVQEHSHMTDPHHQVTLKPDAMIGQLLGGNETLAVNSYHHQVIAELAPTLTATAWASDGVIEAVESKEGATSSPILGVQWHPEVMLFKNDQMLPVFEWFNQFHDEK